ncbi:MAG: HIT domain-containing protein [Anaerolineales bacterium]|nr:HIT domain-containing protein [Anaerolineales bacterium]
MSDECIGCDVIVGRIDPPGGIIYQNSHWVVNHAVANPKPLLKGLLIIQPKRHVEHIADLSVEEMLSFAPLLRNVCLALRKVLQPAKIYACSFGDGVKHVHFIIIPRSSEMPPEGSQVLEEVVHDKLWTCMENEAAEVVFNVREELHKSFKQDG